MITGSVNAMLEPTLEIELLLAASASKIEAVVDTGFNGQLTLPTATIGAWKLPWLARLEGRLADGRIEVFDVYSGHIMWNGQPTRVEIEAVESKPLLGTGLLRGHELRIVFVPNGPVSVISS